MQTVLTNPILTSSPRTNGASRSTCRAGRSLAATAREVCRGGAVDGAGGGGAAASGTRGR